MNNSNFKQQKHYHYTQKKFQQSTVGIDFVSQNFDIDNKTIGLQLWDTSGNERFYILIPSYIRDSIAAVIVYDVTSKIYKKYFLNKQKRPQKLIVLFFNKAIYEDSFNNLTKWIEDVKSERENVVIYILGNKSDKEERKVTFEQGQAKAKEFGVNYAEVSAKSGENINSFFKSLSQTINQEEENKSKSN